jgi:hypothetical protein
MMIASAVGKDMAATAGGKVHGEGGTTHHRYVTDRHQCAGTVWLFCSSWDYNT